MLLLSHAQYLTVSAACTAGNTICCFFGLGAHIIENTTTLTMVRGNTCTPWCDLIPWHRNSVHQSTFYIPWLIPIHPNIPDKISSTHLCFIIRNDAHARAHTHTHSNIFYYTDFLSYMIDSMCMSRHQADDTLKRRSYS